ncbi:carbohydrate ABC transporter permease [Subtercola frigoramans]|uniref:Xylobiose transport system permease protein n=1 Tax=Subtercola frigoramans TaxID=120298 RepID=A0ABS2L0R8_9MICO|nr:carbohydrate ABC transporter permease [Subtercola frigoramans]MBM7470672.1 xylobiose transport system permease protein [Subtercola frigoramans]
MRTKPNYFAGIFAGIWLAIIILPVYLMLRAAFESKAAYAGEGPIGLPTMFTLQNFADAIGLGFGKFLLNAGIITFGTVVIVCLVVPPLAFAIVRSRSRLIRTVFRTMLVGLAIPAQVVVLPVYYLIYQVGLYDTYLGVILPTAAFAIPISTLILTGAMREISGELYEAMAIDGANSFRTFARLVIPLSRGGIATIIVFTMLNAWNGFLLPLVLTRSQDVMVATVGLSLFRQNYSTNIPGLMAAIVLTIIPIFLVYLFARRSLISGLMGVGGK